MRALANVRPLPRFDVWPAALVGLALALFGQFTVVAAQGCAQPSQQGCPLPMDGDVQGVLRDVNEAHYWRIEVPRPVFLLILTDLQADYRLYVYGPDRTLMGQSRNGGREDEVIEIDDASGGVYLVIVDSEGDGVAPAPYRLEAIWLGGPADAVADVSTSRGPTPGTILLSDTFDNPFDGQLPGTSPSPENYVRSYVGGEYQIGIVDPDYDLIPIASIPGLYDDAMLSIDVRLVGDPVGRRLYFGCREQIDGESEYRFVLDPGARQARIDRWDEGRRITLVDWLANSAINAGAASNRVELSCVGSSIMGLVNGTVVASVDDGSYPEGRMWVGVGVDSGTADARFDNLVVAQAGMLPSTAVATVLLADNFDNPAVGQFTPSSTNPTQTVRAYLGGEYQIAKVDPTWDLIPISYVPGSFVDAALAVDVRLVGEVADRRIVLGCRDQVSTESEYRLELEPGVRSFYLSRTDDGRATTLSDGWQFTDAIRPGNETNHLELSCAGRTISAAINGVTVISVEDGAYSEGRMWIGIADAGTTSDARFDNVVVTQR